MSILAFTASAFAIVALAVQYVSAVLAIVVCRRSGAPAAPSRRPPFTLVRPLRGLETYSRRTLASSFAIDYPEYEILFCIADADDAAGPLARQLIADNPQRPARLLVGEEALSANPKLNNMAKGFREARHDLVVFADSNVLLPADYLDRLAERMDAGAGMVTAPPVGHLPQGVQADIECAFLNTFQARVQYAIDHLGFGFAQGKTLCFHRADLERGGLERLASEPAEDAAATKLMRERGKRIRLAGPFAQLIGTRTWAQVWGRQVRWARLRRASFPLLYAPEILAGALPPMLAATTAALALDLNAPAVAACFLALWYAPEIALANAAGWPFSLLAAGLRDLLLPAVYAAGWFGREFEWHGRKLTAALPGRCGARADGMSTACGTTATPWRSSPDVAGVQGPLRRPYRGSTM